MERLRFSLGEDPEEAYKRFLELISVVATERGMEPIILARIVLGLTGQFYMAEAVSGHFSAGNPHLNYLRIAFLQQRSEIAMDIAAPVYRKRREGQRKAADLKKLAGQVTIDEIHRLADELLKTKDQKDVAGIIVARTNRAKSTVYSALKRHPSGKWKK